MYVAEPTGTPVGVRVGDGVGTPVCARVGDGVGTPVGASVGDGVGASVGASVGDGVGLVVGFPRVKVCVLLSPQGANPIRVSGSVGITVQTRGSVSSSEPSSCHLAPQPEVTEGGRADHVKRLKSALDLRVLFMVCIYID